MTWSVRKGRVGMAGQGAPDIGRGTAGHPTRLYTNFPSR